MIVKQLSNHGYKDERENPFSIVGQNFSQEERKISSRREWKRFSKAYESLYKAAVKGPLPFDPKFNAVLWAFDVVRLCKEIAFSYCWMNSYAKFYKEQVSPGSRLAHVDFHVSYFADNCITRIYSCRDKLALMVWAFYCPFNPEKKDEVLNYEKILERLRCPIKFGLHLTNQDDFLGYLETLRSPDFDRIIKYRHLKIHRREPRIEIYGVALHHDWDYMLPLVNKEDIKRWEKEVEKQYPDQQFRNRIKKGCYIKGVPFETRKLKDRLWNFQKVQEHVNSCLLKLLKASDGCFRILRRISPLRNNRSKYYKFRSKTI